MQKLIDVIKRNTIVFLIIILSLPTFFRMLKPGIYSMQDFHFFRLLQFDKCVKTLQIPCRWAPDAGLGYGEPLFNFYGQLPYAIGEIYHLLGGNIIDSVKFLFILSLVGSSISMFFLARSVWKDDFAALISSIVYLYAPYRAVDVWVRGALPEAMAFVIFPLILLSIEKKSLTWFTVSVSILILTHNLSFVMFLPIIAVWIILRKSWKSVFGFLISVFVTAFYVLPVIFESKFVGLESTTSGYFDFRAHFVTLYQIFLSRFWGYGASTWGVEDGLNLSIGLLQWMIPFIILVLVFVKRKLVSNKEFLVLFVLGVFYLFLTHNKSTFIWQNVSYLSYIQFPWRFLGVATFCFALASGAVIQFFEKQRAIVSVFLVLTLILLSFSFFREDIWYSVDDNFFTTGEEWNRQRTASIGDYWPKFGHEIPTSPSDGKFINYFPGWVGAEPEGGLIPSEGTKFKDTTVRTVGNIISLVSIIVFGFLSFRKRKWAKKD